MGKIEPNQCVYEEHINCGEIPHFWDLSWGIPHFLKWWLLQSRWKILENGNSSEGLSAAEASFYT